MLFPGVPLPLHIFEPRYRRLLIDCLASDRLFGILYLAAGQSPTELGPGWAGCVAKVEEQVTLPDGRSNVLVTGVERFLLEKLVDDPAPYHVGKVRPAPDLMEDSAAVAEVAEDVRELFIRVGRAAQVLADEAGALPELPDDPGLLSFRIAGTIDLDVEMRQRLLSDRSALSRLEELRLLLGGVVGPLERQAVVHSRARSNGSGLGQ